MKKLSDYGNSKATAGLLSESHVGNPDKQTRKDIFTSAGLSHVPKNIAPLKLSPLMRRHSNLRIPWAWKYMTLDMSCAKN